MTTVQSLIVKSKIVPFGFKRKCKREISPVINNWNWITHSILKDLLEEKQVLIAAIKADIEKKGIPTLSINRMIDNYGGNVCRASSYIEDIVENYLLKDGDSIQLILIQKDKYPSSHLPYKPYFRNYPSCVFGNPEKQWNGGVTATYILQFFDQEYTIAVFTIIKDTTIVYNPETMGHERWKWTDEEF